MILQHFYENDEEHLENLLLLEKQLEELKKDKNFINLLKFLHKRITILGSDWSFNNEPNPTTISKIKSIIIFLNFLEDLRRLKIAYPKISNNLNLIDYFN